MHRGTLEVCLVSRRAFRRAAGRDLTGSVGRERCSEVVERQDASSQVSWTLPVGKIRYWSLCRRLLGKALDLEQPDSVPSLQGRAAQAETTGNCCTVLGTASEHSTS